MCGEAPRGGRFQASPPFPRSCSVPAPSGRLSSAPRSPSPAATAAAAGILSNRHPRLANPPAWPLLNATGGNSHHATAARCHPGTARGSPAPVMQWPFDPRCSNSARLETHCAEAFGLPQSPRPPHKSSREKLHKKQNISLLSEDCQKFGMHPCDITSSNNPPDGLVFHPGLHCASRTHQWIKLLAGS